MIRLQNVFLAYNKEYYALYDINLTFQKGDRVALIGEEGSGKTAVLRLIAGLEKNQKGDVLISAAGTIGRTVIYDGKPAYYQDSNIVWLDNDESKVINKYLYYYYQLQPWAVSTGGTIARLYNDNISKAKIAVPPLDEQHRIVSVLDRFDALCNDLTSGLPAEIEARQKQYEYYRDKLLTFKPLA